MAYGECSASSTAHGLRKQYRFLDSEPIQYVFQVIREARSVGATLEVARVAEAAVIKGDDFEPTGKKRHLIEPGRVIAAHAVGKNKRRSIPKDFIIDVRHAAAFFVWERSLCSYYEAGAGVNRRQISRPAGARLSVSQRQLRAAKCAAQPRFHFSCNRLNLAIRTRCLGYDA
jgi:hypothetical protein